MDGWEQEVEVGKGELDVADWERCGIIEASNGQDEAVQGEVS